jgi:cyclic pyranopterin phosphate synthase
LPNGYQKTLNEGQPLSIDEIRNLVSAFAQMGFYKIRLTGGEPTVRSDLVEIIAAIRSLSGIQKIALSTNAYRLKSLVGPLKKAGLTHVNISLDSVVPDTFKQITGRTHHQVIEGIEAAMSEGLKVKLNAVLLKETNFPEWDLFLNWVKNRNISFRFIELMRTGDNQEFFKKQYLSSDVLIEKLSVGGWQKVSRAKDDGPAQEFLHPDFRGTIGVIAPYGTEFCDTCNRLRVSALGRVRMCLFGASEFDIRPWLQDTEDQFEVQKIMNNLMQKKAKAHELNQNNFGMNHGFSTIGG